MTSPMQQFGRAWHVLVLVLGVVVSLGPQLAHAEPWTGPRISPFEQALAEAAALDRDLAEIYRSRDFAPIWLGESETFTRRRSALLDALESAPLHGLASRHAEVEEFRTDLQILRDVRGLAHLEVRLSQALRDLAADLQSGVLVPARIDPGLVREVPKIVTGHVFETFLRSEPATYLAGLAPRSEEYQRLIRAKMRLENVIRTGSWGPVVTAAELEPGQSGPAVVALRDRLVAMGYLPRSHAASYDAQLQRAVEDFQMSHGLTVNGVAGPDTIAAVNVPPETRLKSVLVALERERWFDADLGGRHILVNLTDFSARIIDDGEETFRTRAVVGKNTPERRTPEFSDVMDHMVINPSWNVPRSITTGEYLPKLQRNPNALGHLKVVDSSGRVLSRGSVNFARYSARSFPYRLKQPPGDSNALGLVKFMFPNKYNIYLHDTPAKDLFSREVRAYSHGCIRLHQPVEFAHALLARQEADPADYFQSILRTGRETWVHLDVPVPVHIIYRTALTDPQGRLHFRADVYGRDALIWEALEREGVSLATPQG